MLFESSSPVRKTKVLASLGPVSSDEEMIGKLIDAGMDVARFNLAMTDMADIKPVIERVRKVGTSPVFVPHVWAHRVLFIACQHPSHV